MRPILPLAALTLVSCSGVTPLPYRPATTWAQAEANCIATGRTQENCACTGANLSKAVSFERYRDLTAASARVFPVKKTKDEQPMSPNELKRLEDELGALNAAAAKACAPQ